VATQSKLGDRDRQGNLPDYQTRKNRRLCEEQLGFGTAKAVIASRAAMVHVSTLLGSLAGAGS